MYINKELRNKHIERETLSTDQQLVLSLPASLPGYVVLSIGVVSPLRVSGSSSRMELFVFVFVLLSCLVLPVTPWAGCHRDWDKDHRTRENCTTRDFTDVPAGFEPTTKVFLFPKNQFATLSWSSFQIFTKIYELDLTGNKIPEVTLSVAPILPSLSVLRLGSNRLTALSEGSFSACPGLTELYLDHNAVDSLRDHTFSGLSKLEVSGSAC
ncbi:leucine-rich repeat neuronal protein 2 [Anarrhichthys ocellatus]|uniref:leucine-rich repeat neuronal protein 2 n=1 Tax=Anarrhichthys ocellatus TaxID=433405 RepID=UPI0012EDBC46|nr:leucine-rich repeat neuronal protein 2-like [Anarrhichthys ocellatus]